MGGTGVDGRDWGVGGHEEGAWVAGETGRARLGGRDWEGETWGETDWEGRDWEALTQQGGQAARAPCTGAGGRLPNRADIAKRAAPCSLEL